MFFLGFDRNVMPGAAQLEALRTANSRLSWCGYYLAPTPQHSDTSWRGQRERLLASGWHAVPVFLPTPPGNVSTPGAGRGEGRREGAQAVQLALAEGFPLGSFVYLDIESGDALSSTGEGYLGAWAEAVTGAGYGAGIYCSHVIAAQAVRAATCPPPAPPVRPWVFRVAEAQTHPLVPDLTRIAAASPAGSGLATAAIWQFEQNAVLDARGTLLDGLQIDLNRSILQDPSL